VREIPSLADWRRAVDMPVKEPPVTTTVAIPGAKVEEVTWIWRLCGDLCAFGFPSTAHSCMYSFQETRQKRADEYRLVLYNDPLNKREYVARRILLVGTNVAIAWLTLNSSLEVLDDHLLAQRGGCLPGIEHGALHFCIWFMFCFS
jgi:hypothetical protein